MLRTHEPEISENYRLNTCGAIEVQFSATITLSAEMKRINNPLKECGQFFQVARHIDIDESFQAAGMTKLFVSLIAP
jgi:hypothetical protein